MAEAEDVITDVARHATVYAQALWRRNHPAPTGPRVTLASMANRLDLLVAGVFGRSFILRVAQPPAAKGWLTHVLARQRLPAVRYAVPATDGHALWLPAHFAEGEADAVATLRYRTMVLQQAMRAWRGSAAQCPPQSPLLLRELFLLLEARAADAELAQRLPGMARPLRVLRGEALAARPPLHAFAARHRRMEQLTRSILDSAIDAPLNTGWLGTHSALGAQAFTLPATVQQVLAQAVAAHTALAGEYDGDRSPQLLWRDAWTGDLRPAPAVPRLLAGGKGPAAQGEDEPGQPRSARLPRSPQVRESAEDEDDDHAGVWMVQPAQPHEQAEDPMGLQRPTDRDTETAAEDFADALSELPEARLVSAPGRPKEVLLSDDSHAARAKRDLPGSAATASPERRVYPEWDWRAGAYVEPGATVLLLPAPAGPQRWIDDTLAQRGAMLHEIRRRFEMLKAQRLRVRRQLDGEDIDLQSWVDSRIDYRAGLPLDQRLYQTERRNRRHMAVMLLVDTSGSTDGWIAADRRVIDVEREALLLVCLALEGLAEPYSVQAFSGEGPQAVVVRSLKRFDEPYGDAVALRIAGLEPEHYTRAGAALRHATALLMREPAEHRLLLLLSDGKPNDVDDYEGRYGVEDMRQAVTEARLQGISPFCLTVDRQAASYLPAVFGPHHYALLQRPELLPTVLLDWLRRLLST